MTRTARLPIAPAAVDIAGAAQVLGVSERQVYVLRRRPDFPRARVVTPTILRYLVDELVDWLAAQPVAELSGEPPQLVGRKYRCGQPVGEHP